MATQLSEHIDTDNQRSNFFLFKYKNNQTHDATNLNLTEISSPVNRLN